VSSAPSEPESGTRTPPGEVRIPAAVASPPLGRIDLNVESLELRELRHEVKRMLWYVAGLFIFAMVLCFLSMGVPVSDLNQALRQAGVAFCATALGFIALSELARRRPFAAGVFATLLFGGTVLWFSIFRKGGPGCVELLIWLCCVVPLVRALDAGTKYKRLR
jgi:hypothetical protein